MILIQLIIQEIKNDCNKSRTVCAQVGQKPQLESSIYLVVKSQVNSSLNNSVCLIIDLESDELCLLVRVNIVDQSLYILADSLVFISTKYK